MNKILFFVDICLLLDKKYFKRECKTTIFYWKLSQHKHLKPNYLKMIIFKLTADISGFLAAKKESGASIGFVPTMGALHLGHISLINRSVAVNTLTICSIFVNPTQFNDKKDFEHYPITLEQDIDILEKAGCDVLFLPAVTEIYPDGTDSGEAYYLGYLETILEGKHRPGHFQGVCKVVDRLLDIVQPHRLYLGQKDYQQCMVISKLVQLTGSGTRIEIAPTLRAEDGLALSSRNMRLNAVERALAVKIYESLCFIKREIKTGNLQNLKLRVVDFLTQHGFKVDYVEIADSSDLALIEQWDGGTKLVALIAATLDQVRLIDNMLL
jgi:pantoate--beta-alanine ligase